MPRGLGAATTSSNGWIVFESDRTERYGEHIYLMRVDKGGRLRLADDLGPGRGAVPSPDGKRVAFYRPTASGNGLYIGRVDGSRLRKLAETELGYSLEPPRWSPDAKRIAYRIPGPGTTVENLDDGRTRVVRNVGPPSWSPDGRSIVYEGAPSSHPQFLFTLRLTAGTSPVRLPVRGADPTWSPAGNAIAFWSSNALRVVRPNGTRKRVLVRGAVGPYAWSPDGRRMAFAHLNESRGLYIINRDGTGLRRVAVNVPRNRPVWSPDARFVAVAYEEALVVRLFNTRSTRRTAYGLGWPMQRATGPVGWLGRRSMLFSAEVVRNDRDLFAVSPGGSTLRRLTKNTVPDYDTARSPDGSRVAFVREPVDGRGALYVMRLEDRAVTRLTGLGAPPSSPAWAPDGDRIAFVSGSEQGIQVIDLESRAVRPLAPGRDPTWSPDGQQIAFAGLSDIYVIDADGGAPRRLTDNPLLDRSPSWSPDGRRLAFASRTDSHDEFSSLTLALINADGTGLVNLPVPGYNPSWSPDGDQIAFDLRASIWKVRVNGEGLVRLADTSAHGRPLRKEGNPTWLPAE